MHLQPKAIMITLDSTFGDVIGLVARTRVHRVWVVDANHRPIGVVSLFFSINDRIKCHKNNTGIDVARIILQRIPFWAYT
jgi:predicted transcriptional regulator